MQAKQLGRRTPRPKAVEEMALAGQKKKSPTACTDRVARRLKQLRIARGYASARGFADVLGIPENRYTRYERGASEPDFKLIYDICEKLPATPNELFDFGGPASALALGSSAPAVPGFSSGPQAPLEGATAASESGLPGTSRPATHGGPSHAEAPDDMRGPSADTVDAAVWDLAGLLVRCRNKGAILTPLPPLVAITETARVYRGLKTTPFDALSAALAQIETGLLVSTTQSELEAAVGTFLATLRQRAA